MCDSEGGFSGRVVLQDSMIQEGPVSSDTVTQKGIDNSGNVSQQQLFHLQPIGSTPAGPVLSHGETPSLLRLLFFQRNEDKRCLAVALCAGIPTALVG